MMAICTCEVISYVIPITLAALFWWKTGFYKGLDPRWRCPVCKKLDFARNMIEIPDYGEDSHYEHKNCHEHGVNVESADYKLLCEKAEI